jgi:RHS repeat-associated protein
VTGKGQTTGGITKSIGYGYTDGNLTSVVTPSGQTITYGYSNGRVISIAVNGTTLLSNALYDPFGPVTGWTWGNGTLTARTYDQDGNLDSLDSAGAYSYSRDDAFRTTGMTDLSDSSKSWTYGYDLLDRLNTASTSAQTIGYTHDASGNRLTQTGTVAATYSIDASSNRITSITGATARTYAYDGAGNTVADGTMSFSYSDAGRMTSATHAGVTTTYAVDALGQRIRKASSVGASYFMYDERGHLVGEYDVSGTLIQETVWLDDIPVATLRANGTTGVDVFYVHTDHLDTPRRVSRPADNAVVWRWDSDPFGVAPAQTDPDGDAVPFAYNLRFPGQYADAETGLYYNYFRDYAPESGRYVQSDPIGIDGGLNTYAYAFGAPVGLSDPTGERARGGLPALFCKKFPRVCNEIKRCVARPASCKGKFCSAGNALYKSLCNNPGCTSSDSCNSLSFKTSLAAGCYLNRVMAKRFCYRNRSDKTHDDEIEKAKAKVEECIEQSARCDVCLAY